jgi:hypothetical protein
MNLFLVALTVLISGITLIDSISDLVPEESPERIKLAKILHTRAEKTKAFPRLHRPVLATSHESRKCPRDTFVLITEIPYGQAGNQLVELTHGLWLSDKVNGTLVVPKYMWPILSPFHLHEMRKLFCFLEEGEYTSLKADNTRKSLTMKIIEIESEDSFWLQNILGQGLHSKQFKDKHLPQLDKGVVAEMSMYFLDVYASLWGHVKTVVMQEAIRILAQRMKHDLQYTAVHKRDMEGGCAHLFDVNLEKSKCAYLANQIAINSTAWHIAGSSALCIMDATFVSDTMLLHGRDMKRRKGYKVNGKEAHPVYLAWDGKGSIDSYVALDTDYVLSADFRENHSAKELKEAGIHHSDALLKFVDMYMAINADLFLLNPRSTFSFEIYAIRTILGLNSVPILNDKDVYMLSENEYLERAKAGSEGWDGRWVSWRSLSEAKDKATSPHNIIGMASGVSV